MSGDWILCQRKTARDFEVLRIRLRRSSLCRGQSLYTSVVRKQRQGKNDETDIERPYGSTAPDQIVLKRGKAWAVLQDKEATAPRMTYRARIDC